MSDWAYQTLYSLINHRYDWLKTTIITSNYTLDELQDNWQDDRITSRIKRMCELLPKEKILKYECRSRKENGDWVDKLLQTISA